MFIWLGDSLEHVISYWMIFQKFRSPELAGFAIIAHWLPFLLFSIYSGALADRYDPRRLIQVGLGLFMLASLGWGLLFLTDSMEMWHAIVLLIIHGLAGVIIGPASQLLIHDIVGGKDLQSAIRLNSTSRNLGFLVGPAIGGPLMLLIGPAWGILLNVLTYIPLGIWLIRAPYGPKFRSEPPTPRRALRGLADIFETIRLISGYPIIVSMTLLAGAGAFMVGTGHTSQLPEFATALGHGDGLFYSILFGANAAGALAAGIILESREFLPPKPNTAVILTGIWAIVIGAFAITSSYPVAVSLLFVAGFLNLAYNSMSQTLVQLNAPREIRGRVIGLYSMARGGLMTFSGVTVGMVGGIIGIQWSLGISAAILLAITIGLMPMALRARPVAAAPAE
jgi:MFS family permease